MVEERCGFLALSSSSSFFLWGENKVNSYFDQLKWRWVCKFGVELDSAENHKEKSGIDHWSLWCFKIITCSLNILYIECRIFLPHDICKSPLMCCSCDSSADDVFHLDSLHTCQTQTTQQHDITFILSKTEKWQKDNFQTSFIHLQDTLHLLSRHLQDIFQTLYRNLQDTFKTLFRHYLDTFQTPQKLFTNTILTPSTHLPNTF